MSAKQLASFLLGLAGISSTAQAAPVFLTDGFITDEASILDALFTWIP